jgi:hypothetical protein
MQFGSKPGGAGNGVVWRYRHFRAPADPAANHTSHSQEQQQQQRIESKYDDEEG